MPPKKGKKKKKGAEDALLDQELAERRAAEQRRIEALVAAAREQEDIFIGSQRAAENAWLRRRHQLDSQKVWWVCRYFCSDEVAAEAFSAGGVSAVRRTQRAQERLNRIHNVNVQVGPQEFVAIHFSVVPREGVEEVTPEDVSAVVLKVGLGNADIPHKTKELGGGIVRIRVQTSGLSTSGRRLVARSVSSLVEGHSTIAGERVTVVGPVEYEVETVVMGSRWSWIHVKASLHDTEAEPRPPRTLVKLCRGLHEWGTVRVCVRTVCVILYNLLRDIGVLKERPSVAELYPLLSLVPPNSGGTSPTAGGLSRSPTTIAGSPAPPPALPALRRYIAQPGLTVGTRVEVRGRLQGRAVRFADAKEGMLVHVIPSPRSFARLDGGIGPCVARSGVDVFIGEIAGTEGGQIVMKGDWMPVQSYQTLLMRQATDRQLTDMSLAEQPPPVELPPRREDMKSWERR
eukprot:Hpha_TRINITY_DN5857_c0_g1::TRINITY_DN5857_c0_g1_i1::g.45572::m.45572